MGRSTPRRLGRAALLEGVRALTRRDAGLRAIVDAHGPPPLWARPGGFATLFKIILEQQVSLAAAATLYRRLEASIPGGVTPRAVLRVGVEGFRTLGVTRQKSAYLCALAERVHSRELDLRAVARARDDEAAALLVAVPGIGPWSASIYLLMSLGRPDVWPPGDLALHKQMAKVRRRQVPTSDEASRYAERWAPLRAVAARILWHGYLSAR